MQKNAKRQEPWGENEINFAQNQRICTDREVKFAKIVQNAETWEIVCSKDKLEQFIDVCRIEGGKKDSEDQGKLLKNAGKVAQGHKGQRLELAGQPID